MRLQTNGRDEIPPREECFPSEADECDTGTAPLARRRTWLLPSLMFLLIGGMFVMMFVDRGSQAVHAPPPSIKSPKPSANWLMASGLLTNGAWLACHFELSDGSRQLAVLYVWGHRFINFRKDSADCVSIDGVDYYPDANQCRIFVQPKNSDLVNECTTDVKWKFDMQRISKVFDSLPEDWNTSSNAAELIRERIVGMP